MAGEWVRASWDYSPVALSHTGSTIVKALHSFMTQCGWEIAPWSGLTDDRYYLRTDRSTLTITNKTNSSAGNVAITKVGANITVVGMTGGSSTTPAAGTVHLGTSIPADGETFTVSDGTLVKTYEFDSNSTVTPGNIAVVIQPTRSRTMDAVVAAVNGSGQNLTAAALSKRWRFNGDGIEVTGGIRIRWDSGNSRVAIRTFLADNTDSSAAYETADAQDIRVAYNGSIVNSWTIYGGEDGLFMEVGTQGGSLPQNIGHGLIATFSAIPEFRATRDAKVTWTAQGLVMNLFGRLVFGSWTYRFVDTAYGNKNYTGDLTPTCPRGTTDLSSSTQAAPQSYSIIPRDNAMGISAGQIIQVLTSPEALRYASTFGMLNSPVDDRYKLSPIWMIQHKASVYAAASDASATVNVAVSGSYLTMMEPRWIRQLNRLMACDQTLLPFNNITDTITGKTYRITQLADGGRTTNLAVEYPSTAVTIPATPTI